MDQSHNGAKTFLELVCCKKTAKNSSLPVTSFKSRGPLKDLKDSKLILNESKLFPRSSRITLVSFITFRGPLFPKQVTGQELFLAVSYSKPALVEDCSLNTQSVKLGKTWKGMIFLNILWNEMESYVKRKTCETFWRSLRRRSIKLMHILLSSQFYIATWLLTTYLHLAPAIV